MNNLDKSSFQLAERHKKLVAAIKKEYPPLGYSKIIQSLKFSHGLGPFNSKSHFENDLNFKFEMSVDDFDKFVESFCSDISKVWTIKKKDFAIFISKICGFDSVEKYKTYLQLNDNFMNGRWQLNDVKIKKAIGCELDCSDLSLPTGMPFFIKKLDDGYVASFSDQLFDLYDFDSEFLKMKFCHSYSEAKFKIIAEVIAQNGPHWWNTSQTIAELQAQELEHLENWQSQKNY